jgi:hypothetical protein
LVQKQVAVFRTCIVFAEIAAQLSKRSVSSTGAEGLSFASSLKSLRNKQGIVVRIELATGLLDPEEATSSTVAADAGAFRRRAAPQNISAPNKGDHFVNSYRRSERRRNDPKTHPF